MAQNYLPFHVRIESDIINEICLYPNSIQIYVDSFCDEYPTTPSNSIENERVENDCRPSYTLPVRLMYWGQEISRETEEHPDSIIQILGDGLNWQQILDDVESHKAELKWRLINVYMGPHYHYECYFDYECHVEGFGRLIDSEDSDDDPEEDVGSRGAPPAARSAVDNLERQIIESSRDFLCCICQTTLLAGEKCVRMPCNHEYHEGCILQWLETSNSCPACKYELQTDDPEYEAQKQRRNG
ncbi:hypothetical protein SUGI_0465300 [Cryptomeria japonica]|nr:hypothetical protein SUGI_0465300 [Cryptomeria japonica]